MIMSLPSKHDTLTQRCFKEIGSLVSDIDPTLKQRGINVSCLLGIFLNILSTQQTIELAPYM